MDRPCFGRRTLAEHLADAERYEQWAARVSHNEVLSAAFRKLAEEARERAAGG